MSVDLVVHLRHSTMPTPEQWQRAIRNAAFPLELDTDFDVDSATGYRPCLFRGAEAGFEYYSAALSEQEREASGAPTDFDFAVTLVTHSDLRELASSLLAAGALCHASGGLLVDTESGAICPSERALQWAREQLAELERHLH